MKRYRQLTIEGREVSHPPPLARARCPGCERLIAITREEIFYRHHSHLKDDVHLGVPCLMSGRKLEHR